MTVEMTKSRLVARKQKGDNKVQLRKSVENNEVLAVCTTC